MPVQVARPAGRAGPAQLEQPRRGLGRHRVEVHLDLGDLELRLGRQRCIGHSGRRSGESVAAPIASAASSTAARAMNAVLAISPSWRCSSGSSVGRSVTAWLKLRSRERSRATPSSTTDSRMPGDHRVDEQLQGRVLHGRLRLGVVRRVGEQFLRRHRHIAEHRACRCRCGAARSRPSRRSAAPRPGRPAPRRWPPSRGRWWQRRSGSRRTGCRCCRTSRRRAGIRRRRAASGC